MRRDKRVLVSEFQFHKVRLKEIREALEQVEKLFQFHKVRLKAPARRQDRRQHVAFQFHKVRLKGCMFVCKFHCITRFNSIRYD